MDKVTQPAPQHERLDLIGRRLDDDGSVRIDELAESLGVSEMTIRRDLDELEAQGVARRVRGGALAIGPETFDSRHRLQAKAKGRIAEKLGTLVPTTGAVGLDASSTIHRLAATLDGARDLVVVTHGMDTFHVLQNRPGVTPTLTGGEIEPRTGSLVGPLAARSVEGFLFDVFFASAAALDPEHGSSETSLADADTKRAFARHSGRVILAVDHSKFGTRGQARTFGFEDIDVLVTDLDVDDDRLDPYRDVVEVL